MGIALVLATALKRTKVVADVMKDTMMCRLLFVE
jgi:hypothetical protein